MSVANFGKIWRDTIFSNLYSSWKFEIVEKNLNPADFMTIWIRKTWKKIFPNNIVLYSYRWTPCSVCGRWARRPPACPTSTRTGRRLRCGPFTSGTPASGPTTTASSSPPCWRHAGLKPSWTRPAARGSTVSCCSNRYCHVLHIFLFFKFLIRVLLL